MSYYTMTTRGLGVVKDTGPMLWTEGAAWDWAEQSASPGGAAAKAFCDGRKVGVLIGAGAVGVLWAGAILWYMKKR